MALYTEDTKNGKGIVNFKIPVKLPLKPDLSVHPHQHTHIINNDLIEN